MIWETIALWVASYVIGELLRDGPEIKNAQASGLDAINVPTADAQRMIPIVFGRALVKDPNLIWYGDSRPVPIVQRIKTGLFSSQKQTVGYSYYLGWHYVLCLSPATAPAALRELRVDGELVLGSIGAAGAYTLNSPNLFGGYKAGGGLTGTLRVLDGNGAQTVPSYLQQVLGTPQPAHRGVLSAVAEQCYIGETLRLPNTEWMVERYPNPLSNGLYLSINGDSNPVLVLLEAQLSNDYGRGRSLGVIDTASFSSAAATVHGEGLGFSLRWTPGDVYDLEKLLLDHISGLLYDDPQTGKLTIKLIRDTENPATATLLDESNIIDLTDYVEPTLQQLVAELSVTWTDRETGQPQQTTLHNSGLEEAQLGWSNGAMERNYPGCGRSDVASKLAERDFGIFSNSLSRAEVLVALTVGMALRPGQLVRLSWADYGLVEVPMRVQSPAYGELTEGFVRIKLIADVFRSGSPAYATQPALWSPAVPAPTAVSQYVAEAITYRQIIADTLTMPGSTQTGIALIAAAPTGNSLDFDLYGNDGSSWSLYEQQVPFAPRLLTTAAVTPGQTVIAVSGLTLAAAAAAEIGGLVWLDGEQCRLTALDAVAGTVTLARGCIDTVARAHSSGAVLYLVAAGIGGVLPLTAGVNGQARLLTRATSGALPLGSAPTVTVPTVDARHLRPYPPGKLRINGSAYPASISGALSITWAHRDRIAQSGELRDESATDIGPETGVTYTLKLYGDGGTLRRTETGLTANSYTWTTEAADSGGSLNSQLRIVIETFRSGLESHTKHDFSLSRV